MYFNNESESFWERTGLSGLASALKEEFPEILLLHDWNYQVGSDFEISYNGEKIH